VLVALDHLARELRTLLVAAELSPGDEELLVRGEAVDVGRRRLLLRLLERKVRNLRARQVADRLTQHQLAVFVDGRLDVVGIFSSGSVLAQKQFFAHTEAGDLSRYIDAYFGTTTGAKRDVESYRAIARELRRPSAEITFISDTAVELDAASAAGLNALLCMRPGNRPQPDSTRYASIHSFDEIL
jgi:phosphoglycolate phosphatase-like HAD superfamily hydrolase